MAAAQPAISQSKHLWCLKDMFCSRVKIGDQKMFSYGRGVSPGTNAVIYRHTITSVMLQLMIRPLLPRTFKARAN